MFQPSGELVVACSFLVVNDHSLWPSNLGMCFFELVGELILGSLVFF